LPSIDGPTTTAARIRDQNIDPAPFLDDACHHCLDRRMVADIDLDAYGSIARLPDLGDRAIGSHILGFGLKFLCKCRFRRIPPN
jgi:hypothetical protein